MGKVCSKSGGGARKVNNEVDPSPHDLTILSRLPSGQPQAPFVTPEVKFLYLPLVNVLRFIVNM